MKTPNTHILTSGQFKGKAVGDTPKWYRDNLVQCQMGEMKQRDLDGTHFWIKEDGSCLMVCRGKIGPEIESIEGEWSDEEKAMGIYLYQFTEAAKR